MRITAARSDAGPAIARISVVKFGSSVLKAPADATAGAAEIARLAARGRRVLAVVSAFLGETDRLIAEAASLSGGVATRHAARLVSLGETRACLALTIACEAAGLNPAFLDVEAMGLAANGSDDEATPVSVDRVRLLAALAAHDVLIVPGFAALKDGRTVLLGRGGSDLTAVFLATELGLDCATLVKDVDGVYDRDPAVAGASARRYESLDYDAAAEVAGKLVQPRAIRFAQTHSVAIEVRRLGEDRATRIGAAEAVHTDAFYTSGRQAHAHERAVPPSLQ